MLKPENTFTEVVAMDENKRAAALDDELLDRIAGGHDMGEGYIHCPCGNGDYDQMHYIGIGGLDGKYWFNCHVCGNNFTYDL